MSGVEQSPESGAVERLLIRHRFLATYGRDEGFCAGPYCSGLVSPEQHAAHVAALLTARTDVTPPGQDGPQ